MQPQYAVVAFPVLAEADSVEAVRRRFDPLANVLAAHVTLVFPFGSDLSEASLADHVSRAAESGPPFAISLIELSVESGGYLFLNVGEGADRFHNLNARLYSGPLASHRSSAHDYRPHVTVGCVPDQQGFADARRQAHLLIRLPILGNVPGLAIFRLDRADSGTVICTVPFH